MPLASVALPGSLSASILRSAFLPQDHKQEPAGHGASETVTQTCFFQGSLLYHPLTVMESSHFRMATA